MRRISQCWLERLVLGIETNRKSGDLVKILQPRAVAVCAGSEFVTGWTGKRGRKLKSKLEKTKQKVKSMARELYDDHFKAVESMPRGVVVTLRNISTQLESSWELHTNRQVPRGRRTRWSRREEERPLCHQVRVCVCQGVDGENTWRDLMKTALENLIVVLKDENTISPYEMCSSGLVQALFTVLNNVGQPAHSPPLSRAPGRSLTLCRRPRFWCCCCCCSECRRGPETRL